LAVIGASGFVLRTQCSSLPTIVIKHIVLLALVVVVVVVVVVD